MESPDFYKLKISPFDSAVEWFIKGANLGVIYGICFASEAKIHEKSKSHWVNIGKFIAKNGFYTGCILSTWWFFNTLFLRITSTDNWINYSVSGGLTAFIWRKHLEIAPDKLKRAVLLASVFCGFLGNLIVKSN